MVERAGIRALAASRLWDGEARIWSAKVGPIRVVPLGSASACHLNSPTLLWQVVTHTPHPSRHTDRHATSKPVQGTSYRQAESVCDLRGSHAGADAEGLVRLRRGR